MIQPLTPLVRTGLRLSVPEYHDMIFELINGELR
jgi:hypothetical protein